MPAERRLAAAALALAASCMSTAELQVSQPPISGAAGDHDWIAAQPGDLEGLFESVEIEGQAAGTLLRIYYCFNADHTYTGAELTTGAAHAQFTTLSGAWELSDRDLVLDSGEGLSASVSGDLLKLANERGTAILKRATIQ